MHIENSSIDLSVLKWPHHNSIYSHLNYFWRKEEDECFDPVQEKIEPFNTFLLFSNYYEKLSIGTATTELCTTVELWNDVVECYQRVTREQLAQEVIKYKLTTNNITLIVPSINFYRGFIFYSQQDYYI